jgi:hypothetical protein
MGWKNTLTLNKITGKPNKIMTVDRVHALVYMREYGWSYTDRAPILGHRWVQASADNARYFSHMHEAMDEAYVSAIELSKIAGSIITDTPLKPNSGKMLIPQEIFESLGIRSIYLDDDDGWVPPI